MHRPYQTIYIENVHEEMKAAKPQSKNSRKYAEKEKFKYDGSNTYYFLDVLHFYIRTRVKENVDTCAYKCNSYILLFSFSGINEAFEAND